MGLKDFFNTKNKNVFVIDKPTFRLFLIEQIEKARMLKYPIAENITLFQKDKQKTIFVSYDIEEDNLEIECDGYNYQDLNGFLEHIIIPIPGEYIKIQLDWKDEEMLINYKKAHPNLKPEDY